MVWRGKRTDNERCLPCPELLSILTLEGAQGIDPWIGYPHHIEYPVEKRQAEFATSLLRSLCRVAPKRRTVLGIQGKEGRTRERPEYISVGLHKLLFSEYVDSSPICLNTHTHQRRHIVCERICYLASPQLFAIAQTQRPQDSTIVGIALRSGKKVCLLLNIDSVAGRYKLSHVIPGVR